MIDQAVNAGIVIGFFFGVLLGGPAFGIYALYRERKRVRKQKEKYSTISFGD